VGAVVGIEHDAARLRARGQRDRAEHAALQEVDHHDAVAVGVADHSDAVVARDGERAALNSARCDLGDDDWALVDGTVREPASEAGRKARAPDADVTTGAAGAAVGDRAIYGFRVIRRIDRVVRVLGKRGASIATIRATDSADHCRRKQRDRSRAQAAHRCRKSHENLPSASKTACSLQDASKRTPSRPHTVSAH
jgi:hypothetical protein